MPLDRQADPQQRRRFRYKPGLLVAILCAAGVAAGCARLPQARSVETTSAAAEPRSLAGGLAILTPTAASGHEEDRQTVALVFARTLTAQRPDLVAIALPATLSAINANGLGDAYRHMYAAYRETGLFDAELLRKIGPAVGARYLLQLKLAAFDQSGSGGAFSFLGASLLRQQTADIRLLAQIWDSANGTLVWERSDEATERRRSLVRVRTIRIEDVVEAAAKEVIKQLPRG